MSSYDKIIGLRLSDAPSEKSLNKSPAGGEGTGKISTDLGKLGYKWHLLAHTDGIFFG